MRLMSFKLTEAQILAQSKHVTRRDGWLAAKAGDVVQPVRQAMGLRKGDRVVTLGPPIRLTRVERVPLDAGMTYTECQLEGFPSWSPAQFVAFIVAGRGLTLDELAAASGIARAGGTFRTYLSKLKTRDLITVAGGRVRLSEDLQ